MKCFNLKTLGLVAVASLLLVCEVNAEAIAVVNPAFDYVGRKASDGSEVLNPLGFWNAEPLVPDTWIACNTGIYNAVKEAGWYSTVTDVGNSGMYVINPEYWLANNYPGANNSTGFAHQAATPQLLWQTLAGQLKADTTYTLSVELYARSNAAWIPAAENIVAKLTDGSGNDLAGGLTSITFPTTAGPGSAVFTVATGSITPGDLRIVLGNATPVDAAFSTIAFDNVTLDAVTIPEPSALILLSMGLVSLLAYAWRRRK